MRNVVTAVEKIVDKHLPVAMDVVGSPVKVVELADAERSDALNEAAEKFGERLRVIVQINEDKAFPGFHSDRNEALFRAIEILNSFELGHAF
jgi:predicted amino acid racemase